MDYSKPMSDYLALRKGRITDLLQSEDLIDSNEQVHCLRVEIKQLNSLLKLLKNSVVGFDRKRSFKPVKSVFKEAGE